jgi:hypothetical protein
VLESILVGAIDAPLLRKAMQSCSGVDRKMINTVLTPNLLARACA